MKMPDLRLNIFLKDVMRITGKSEATASRMTNKVRRAKGKQSHQCVTISEFADHYGYKFDDLKAYIS